MPVGREDWRCWRAVEKKERRTGTRMEMIDEWMRP
jgi:hypothetical protein